MLKLARAGDDSGHTVHYVLESGKLVYLSMVFILEITCTAGNSVGISSSNTELGSCLAWYTEHNMVPPFVTLSQIFVE